MSREESKWENSKKSIILNVPSLFSAEFTCLLQDKRIGKFTFLEKNSCSLCLQMVAVGTHTRNFYGDYVAPTQEEVLFT